MIIDTPISRDDSIALACFLFWVVIVLHAIIVSDDTDVNVKVVASVIGMILLPLVAIASNAWDLIKDWRKLSKRDKAIELAILTALVVGTTAFAVLMYMHLMYIYQEAVLKTPK